MNQRKLSINTQKTQKFILVANFNNIFFLAIKDIKTFAFISKLHNLLMGTSIKINYLNAFDKKSFSWQIQYVFKILQEKD